MQGMNIENEIDYPLQKKGSEGIGGSQSLK